MEQNNPQQGAAPPQAAAYPPQPPYQHLLQQQQQQLQMFWTYQRQEIEQVNDFKNHQLPLARIKKIMKADEDVRMISAEAPILSLRVRTLHTGAHDQIVAPRRGEQAPDAPEKRYRCDLLARDI
ncbi:UNVERIFIED_CONTAM: Nuclear transcription factor Y subunit C-4 [Sesamum radiatum]|uniref:Nuclear transcription factor Y subunit C-4 n=1 Tax=Sesamum radiatum TaxID=300843 RepID=A0AAW2WP69_SESRA